MKATRWLLWLVALVPALAAAAWATFAAGWPEPALQRRALCEALPRWSWHELFDSAGEPLHWLGRALHLAALQIPGATLASVVWVNALLALLIAVLIGGLLRCTFALRDAGAATALGLAGLLVASPVYGVLWLYGERMGMLAVPLLLLLALTVLQGEGKFALRALTAILLAGLAPFAHTHGVVVFLALLPALHGAARRAGSGRLSAWIGLCLVVGNVAAAWSLRHVDALRAEGASWPADFVDGFVASGVDLLARLGDAWPDLLPGARIDAIGLGALTLLLPLLLWRLGDRSPAAVGRAAPWWSCFWFGVAVVVLDLLRYDHVLPHGIWAEATYGTFLLPLGVGGVLGARFGSGLLQLLAGVLLLVMVQQWWHGIEDLRLARLRVDDVTASMALPPSLLPAPSPSPVPVGVETLRAKGWVPGVDEGLAAALVAAGATPPTATNGSCDGVDAATLGGRVRASLRFDAPVVLFALGWREGGDARVLGVARPDFARFGREVPWRLSLTERPAAGEHVRVVGYLPRERQLVAVGPAFTFADGAWRREDGT